MDYGNLDFRERVKMTIEATASKDFDLVATLVKSCPKETVEVIDLEFSNTARMLMRVAALFESEMRGLALSVLESADPPPIMAQMNAAKISWERFCATYDLLPATLIESVGGHHPIVRRFLGWCCLPPDESLIEHWKDVFHAAATGELVSPKRH